MTNLIENSEVTKSNTVEVYFEMHSAAETEVQLHDLLQAWLCPDTLSKRTMREIADRVFFVHNISALIRNSANDDFLDECHKVSVESSESVSNFFDQLGAQYPQDLILDALQSWISPDGTSQNESKVIADVVGAFEQIRKLVIVLNVLNAQLTVKGGLLCA